MSERFMWPTPSVCGNYNRKGASPTSGDGLATAVLRASTSSAGGSPARTSARRGKAQASTASVPACGESSHDLLPHSGPDGCWWRMCLLSVLADMTGSRQTWKRQATPSGRPWWVLTTWEHPIDASASGSWPTPRASEFDGRGGAQRTPGTGGATLSQSVKQFPTPTANRRDGLQSHAQNIVAGSLNPQFVEWLQGYPRDWTEVE